MSDQAARDRAIEDARAWLQGIIDDRPEGAYDAADHRHARTLLRALAGAPTADVAAVVVGCTAHGLRALRLDGPEEMCSECRVLGTDGNPLGWDDGRPTAEGAR